MPHPQSAYPGQSLASTKTHTAGPGTHIHNSEIIASLSGTISTTTVNKAAKTPTISILRPHTSSPSPPASSASISIPSRQISTLNTLPSINAVVLARVTRLGPRQANLSICAVDGVPCADDFAAVIRREDVRGWEVDRVRVEESFAVGDVVRGVVISLGDQSSYYLSTARNELGVLLAVSTDSGNQMVPVSWRAFRDPLTGKEESRKVAKPV